MLAMASVATAAHATAHRSEHGADVAQSVNSQVTIYDNECDAQWVRANYYRTGGYSGGINNKSGCGTSASLNAGGVVTAIQACESRTALPMSCSEYNTEC